MDFKKLLEQKHTTNGGRVESTLPHSDFVGEKETGVEEETKEAQTLDNEEEEFNFSFDNLEEDKEEYSDLDEDDEDDEDDEEDDYSELDEDEDEDYSELDEDEEDEYAEIDEDDDLENEDSEEDEYYELDDEEEEDDLEDEIEGETGSTFFTEQLVQDKDGQNMGFNFSEDKCNISKTDKTVVEVEELIDTDEGMFEDSGISEQFDKNIKSLDTKVENTTSEVVKMNNDNNEDIKDSNRETLPNNVIIEKGMSVKEFVRLNKDLRTMSDLRKYYSMAEINSAIKYNQVFYSKKRDKFTL